MTLRRNPPESDLVPPTWLAARFDELDDELPPTPRWRPAGPAGAGTERLKVQVRRRAGAPSPRGTLTTGVLALVIGLTALGVGARIATRTAVEGPAGPQNAASPIVPGVSPSAGVPGPSETPGSPEPSFAFDSPAPSTSPSPGKTLAPLRFATLKLVERPGSVEDILTGDFGWACPVQVPPPADLTAQALTKILAGPGTSPGLRKGFGFVVWAGTNPEDAAIAFGASLVVRDGAGDLWLLLRSGGTSVRHLERMLAADGTVAWWLTDAVAAGKCPDRSAPAGTRG